MKTIPMTIDEPLPDKIDQVVKHPTLHVPRPTPHVPRPTSLALFLFLLALYLLTYTPRLNSSDGLAMLATAESLVRRGAFDIEQLRWLELQQGTFGLDGRLYSRKGIGVPIGLLPLTWVGLVMPGFGPVTVSLLFNAIVTALTAVVLLAYLEQLGYSRRVGLIAALTFGLSTLAWPYAKSLFSDPFSGLLLSGAAWALLKFRQALQSGPPTASQRNKDMTPFLPQLRPDLYYPCLAGLLLGWNVATRYAEALFLPVFGVLLLYYLYEKRGYFVKPILAFAAPLVLIGLGLVAFNLSRYGDPLNTGYLPNETFSGVLWQGIAGQLLSPGRGLWLYCPVLLLSLWGFWPFVRRFRPEALLALSVILIHLFLYGKWFMWHGGYAWGPRFMIPTLPFWVMFLAPLLERAFPGPEVGSPNMPAARDREAQAPPPTPQSPTPKAQPSILRIIFLTLAILGLIPQLLSAVIDFAPFQNALLETGLPLFAPETFFNPRYSPFLGAWAFISLDTLDLAWMWQGQLNGWLLAALILNLALTAFNLHTSASPERPVSESTPERIASERIANERIANQPITSERIAPALKSNPSRPTSHVPPPTHYALRTTHYALRPTSHVLPLLACTSTLLALILLLRHAHSLPPESLQQTIAALNRAVRPTDAVIINDPELTMPFAELYTGRAPVLSLNSGGFPLPDDLSRRLAEIRAHHQQVWWLPNRLPAEASAVEQTLRVEGFPARNDNFEGQRLALFLFPPDSLIEKKPVNVVFGDVIGLLETAYPSAIVAGAGLPLELQWQALAVIPEDYHVFIHLVAGEGQLTAQTDGQPVHWSRPTSTWSAGEMIIDRHGLWIPPETEPGRYQLLVGLYRPGDGQRLSLPDGADSASFEVIITAGLK